MDAPSPRQGGGDRPEAGERCLRAGQRHVNPLVNLSGVVVHFGMPKTGTTSIQLSLSRRLADDRFHYVNLGGDPNYAIATAFKADPARDRRHVKLGTPSRE